MPALHDAIIRIWRKRGPVSWLLWPVSWVYRGAIRLRTLGYQTGLFSSVGFEVPVIVVGNISSGGVGKTPVTVAICEHLVNQGWRPGIVSRGYGGSATQWPQAVTPDSPPDVVGDEPVLLAGRTERPVYVSPNRPDAVARLLSNHDCNVILSDDGLQHLALQRDIEIVVFNGESNTGNGFCLPAGPLREPRSRLDCADFVVNVGSEVMDSAYSCSFEGNIAINVMDAKQCKSLTEFSAGSIHGVAGIGQPERFFEQLEHAGLMLTRHPFPDHHKFTEEDLSFVPETPILMTEKDAVKCVQFPLQNMWYVPIKAKINAEFYIALDNRLSACKTDRSDN